VQHNLCEPYISYLPNTAKGQLSFLNQPLP
jgi:hypothetical protein